MTRTFRSTGPRGLDHDGFPLRLYHKAKRLGTWDPAAVDLTRDRADWARLAEEERDVLLRLTALFQAGEESVVLDLLPLLRRVAAEGRLEEEMYLATFLFEEAKHVEAFRRFLDEVAGPVGALDRYHTPSYLALFGETLPAAMTRLDRDDSPGALAEASVTYNMIVEGVLAETGYHAYHAVLARHGILPGTLELVGLVKRDESRHLAYGVYLLSRLVAEHGDGVWGTIRDRMEALLPLALGTVGEVFSAYDPMPFGLRLEDFTDFAIQQFQHRLARIERARGQTIAEIEREEPA